MATQAAWSISIELLSASGALESASPLHYFSANTIYTKVRKHWHQLETEHRDQLGAVILQVRSSRERSVRPGRGSVRYTPLSASIRLDYVSYTAVYVVFNQLCQVLLLLFRYFC